MKAKHWVGALLLVLAGWFHLWAAPAWGAVAFVQSKSGVASPFSATGTTITATFTSNVVAGHLIAVYVTYDNGGGITLNSVTDSLGNTYTIVQTLTDTVNVQKSSVAYAKNIAGGANTVTATFSAAICCRLIIVHEISGADTAAPLDGNFGQLQAAPGTGVNAVTTGNMTTTANGDYIFGATSDSAQATNQTISAGTGETIRENNSQAAIGGNATASEDKIQATAGAVASTFTFNVAGGASLTLQMAFKRCPAPPDAGYVAANAQSGQSIVYWSSANPVIILRKTSAFAGEAPVDGTGYTAGATIGTATVVYDGATAVAGTTCTATSCTQTGLTNGTTYYYKVFAETGSGGSSCYAPGTVNTTAGVVARPATGAGFPTWSYALAGGSILKGGTAGTGTLYATSNASRIVSLKTVDGTQSWDPVATNSSIQAWLTWLPVGTGGVKSVQTGTATMTTQATLNVPITAVNLAQSILFFNVQEDNVDPSNGQVRGQLTSSTNIQFNRTGTTTTITIKWYVAEFLSGVSVQRGTTAVTTVPMNIPITAVNLGRTFVLASWQKPGATYGNDDFLRARLTSTTNLELTHDTVGASLDGTADWQVVSMTGASVQSGDVTFPTADASKTVTVTTVDTAKTFLLATWNSDANGIGANFIRGRITSPTQLTFDRGATGSTINLTWFLVTLNDGSTVQSGNASFSSTTTTLPVTLSPAVGLTKSVAFLSANQRGGSTPYAGISPNDNPGVAWFTADLTSSTNLQLTRSVTGSATAEAPWFVVQFPQSGGSASVIGVDQGTGATSTGRVYSVDPATGITNWQVTLTADAFQAGPAAQMQAYSSAAFKAAYTDDVLFAATLNTLGTFTTNNKVFALGASNGALLWTFSGTMDGVVGMPWVDYARDRIYVTSRAGSAGTQQSLWVIKTVDGEGVLKGQAMSCSLCSTLGHLETSPTLSFDGLTLYVGNTAGTLYAINAANLTLKWSLALGTAITGFVWEDFGTNGRLYFAAADGTVRCIRDQGTSGAACTGWTSPSVPGPSTPLLLGSKLFVGSWNSGGAAGQKGKLYQINTTTGACETKVVVGDGEKQPGDVSTETGSEIFGGTSEGVSYKFPLTGGSLSGSACP